jgi:hypothetical protein
MTDRQLVDEASDSTLETVEDQPGVPLSTPLRDWRYDGQRYSGGPGHFD